MQLLPPTPALQGIDPTVARFVPSDLFLYNFSFKKKQLFFLKRNWWPVYHTIVINDQAGPKHWYEQYFINKKENYI